MGGRMLFRKKDYDKARELLAKLSLQEKIGMIHGAGLFETRGVERLGIPPLKMSDGPMGVRREFHKDSWEPAGNNDDYVTYLPCNSAIAATWNRELAHRCGQVLGEEARGRGKDVILAPGINIQRSPLCGRNFEYMSEDPYLAGEQAVSLIRGIQENDVAACVKHFALNNQERNRLWVNTKVSERALREIYLPAFRKAALEGKSLTLMGAYNLVRGVRCCENAYLLDDILRKEWDWDGAVISDWGGILRTKESAAVSIDVEMSIYSDFDNYHFARPLLEAVQKGEVEERLIDEKVFRILCLMSALHMLDGTRKSGCVNTKPHQHAALDTARESIVLLKNEEGRLPLSSAGTKKLLVIGDNAVRMHALGGGSAEVKALYEIPPLAGIKYLLGGQTQVTFARGYYVPDENDQSENWQEKSLQDREGTTAPLENVSDTIRRKREELRKEALALAAAYEHVIFIGGLNHQYDLEDQDRRNMTLPYGQDELINALLDVNPNMIVVMMAGSPVETFRWDKRAKAILWQWYAGMEGGTALSEVLFGKVNPSGKLPETFPVVHTDCSAHCVGNFGDKDEVDYREGIFVGYRYYEKKKVKVSFPFGHGLSYTEFLYGKCRIAGTTSTANTKAAQSRGAGTSENPGRAEVMAASANVEEPGAGNGSDADHRMIVITVPVRNIGKCAGKEVVQLYLSKNSSRIERPVKELKGYEKIALQPGEEKEVSFTITAETLEYYDENAGKMQVEEGAYTVQIGASSADIRCVAEFDWKNNEK